MTVKEFKVLQLMEKMFLGILLILTFKLNLQSLKALNQTVVLLTQTIASPSTSKIISD